MAFDFDFNIAIIAILPVLDQLSLRTRSIVLMLSDTIRVMLRRQHKMKLPDAIVWATAQVNKRLLVTRNTKDYPWDEPGIRVPYQI